MQQYDSFLVKVDGNMFQLKGDIVILSHSSWCERRYLRDSVFSGDHLL
jgi:hypothetical protein